jgi:hypothetical protein
MWSHRAILCRIGIARKAFAKNRSANEPRRSIFRLEAFPAGNDDCPPIVTSERPDDYVAKGLRKNNFTFEGILKFPKLDDSCTLNPEIRNLKLDGPA